LNREVSSPGDLHGFDAGRAQVAVSEWQLPTPSCEDLNRTGRYLPRRVTYNPRNRLSGEAAIHRSTFGTLALAILALALSVSLVARDAIAGPGSRSEVRANTPLGTGFTYQGKLENNSVPTTGACDFQFGLFDQESNGLQSGVTETVGNVQVLAGLFSVAVNSTGLFGPSAFDGNVRWLQVATRCPAGSGNYTLFAARQPITPAPYAIFSKDAARLVGIPGAEFAHYKRTIIVPIVPSDPIASGDRLKSTLAGITDSSDTNQYLIQLEPGVYNVGASTLTIVDGITLQGAGSGISFFGGTRISGTDVGILVRVVGQAVMNSIYFDLRNISLTGTAISMETPEVLTLNDVIASAASISGSALGIAGIAPFLFMSGGAVAAQTETGLVATGISSLGSVRLNNVIVSVRGGAPTRSRGIDAPNGDVTIEGGSVTVQDGQFVDGISLVSGDLMIANTTVAVSNDIAVGSTAGIRTRQKFTGRGLSVSSEASNGSAIGIEFSGPSTFNSSSVLATGGSFSAGIAISSGASTVRIYDVTIEARNGSSYGFYASGGAGDSAFIQNSFIHGDSNSVRRLAGVVRIGASQLSGATFGAPTCVGNFNAIFAPVAVCP
jgi:hypothetical protein